MVLIHFTMILALQLMKYRRTSRMLQLHLGTHLAYSEYRAGDTDTKRFTFVNGGQDGRNQNVTFDTFTVLLNYTTQLLNKSTFSWVSDLWLVSRVIPNTWVLNINVLLPSSFTAILSSHSRGLWLEMICVTDSTDMMSSTFPNSSPSIVSFATFHFNLL